MHNSVEKLSRKGLYGRLGVENRTELRIVSEELGVKVQTVQLVQSKLQSCLFL
jgi:hypothetical protein